MTKVTNPPGTACYTYSSCLALLKAGKKINYEGASGDLDYNKYNNTFGPYGAFQATGRDRAAGVRDVGERARGSHTVTAPPPPAWPAAGGGGPGRGRRCHADPGSERMADCRVPIPAPRAPAASFRRPPLAGVHVLDLARVLAGPYAAMLLGDSGAEVIKVERPGPGTTPGAGARRSSGRATGTESTYFLSVNRGKRSVAIDLKDPAEREFVEPVVRWGGRASRELPSRRDGPARAWAMTRLAELNPRLIRLSISGFGEAARTGTGSATTRSCRPKAA